MSDRIVIGRRVEDEPPEPPEPWDSSRETARKRAKPRAKRGEPVTLSREQLKKGHAHVRGRTGSGKSQLVLLPIVLQLLESYTLEYRDRRGTQHRVRENDAVCIFDNGGDRAMFNAIRKAAQRLGRTFRYFSLDSQKSHGFDPFQSVPACEDRIIRLCNLLTEALNLEHGSVYGGAYFTQRNLAQLLAVAEKAVEEKVAGRNVSLGDIDRFIQQKQHQIKDAEQVRMIFRFLTRYEQLQPQSTDSQVIDFRRAIEEREVIYFFTPTLGEAVTARQISGLGLYNAVNAAVELAEQREGDQRDRPVPHVHLIVDEFQELVGRGFASLMAQARKFGCSMVCANQSTEQLKNRDLSLADIVRDNTTTKVYFTCSGKSDTEELQSYSKQARATLTTTRAPTPAIANSGRTGGGDSFSEYVTPLLTANAIIDTTATAREFFLVDQTGSGHHEPVRTRADYVLTEDEYLRHLNTPLASVTRPKRQRSGDKPVASVARWEKRHRAEPDLERAALLKKLREKVADLMDEQRWA